MDSGKGKDSRKQDCNLKMDDASDSNADNWELDSHSPVIAYEQMGNLL